MRFLRVFSSGAEESRGDSARLGAAAYTDANRPPAFAKESWHVEARKDDELPPVPFGLTAVEARAAWLESRKHRLIDLPAAVISSPPALAPQPTEADAIAAWSAHKFPAKRRGVSARPWRERTGG